MTNREWLINKMQNMSDEELGKSLDSICTVINRPIQECTSECKECLTSWLKEEHKEKPKMLDVEREILKNIDKKYKWILRDEDGLLKVYSGKPCKQTCSWFMSGCEVSYLACFNHLFQFIKWEDKEPYEISELLKGE